MRKSKIGRWGEDLVCRWLGFTRQPASGAIWPWKEDLTRVADPITTGVKEIAQVKTSTRGAKFLDDWAKLQIHAVANHADHKWYQVYKNGPEALIFEVRLVAKGHVEGPQAVGRGGEPEWTQD